MTPERFEIITRVLSQRQPDLTVIADEVHKGRNMAAIVRTCDAVGIAKMYSVVPDNGYRPYRGTALGANKWVEVELCDKLRDGVKKVKAEGMQIVSAGLDEHAVDFREVDYTRPTALLMSNEKHGLSDLAKEHSDHIVTIPMVGMVESLNVSVAAAIILNEAQYQRQKAGMYATCRLPEQEFNRLFFRWAHPKITEFCDEKGLAYPALREDGEIIDPSAWYASVRAGTAATSQRTERVFDGDSVIAAAPVDLS